MDEKRTQLIKQLEQFRDENKVPQARLAKKLGMNEGRLSSWLSGTYKGKNEEIDDIVEKFLTLEAQKSQGKIEDVPFVQTSVATQLFIAAQTCQMDNLIGICYGDPGLGKTEAINEYARNNAGVIIIDCEERMKVKLLIEALYKKLNLGNEKNWDIQDMKEKIFNKLNDSGWLLIIDEAEWLSEDSFTVLRKLHDRSNRSFGILFTGTHKLFNNLQKYKGEYLYITSRIALTTELKKLKNEDIRAIIDKALPDAGEDVISELLTKTNNNTRVLTTVIKRAKTAAKRHNLDLDSELIASCRRMLII